MADALPALITGALTLSGGIATGYFAPGFAAGRDRRLKAREAEARFHEALLASANDLQSRLWNIVDNQFLRAYYDARGPEDPDRVYAETNTLWLVGQHFCWHELLRRDRGYFALGSAPRGKELLDLLDAIRRTFATDKYEPEFRVFWGAQRAIGEIMATQRTAADQTDQPDCIGYAAFLTCIEDAAFARWFASLRGDIEATSARLGDGQRPPRLVKLQNHLIDLVDFFDPAARRIPEGARGKLAA
jgi:hypothetical protein